MHHRRKHRGLWGCCGGENAALLKCEFDWLPPTTFYFVKRLPSRTRQTRRQNTACVTATMRCHRFEETKKLWRDVIGCSVANTRTHMTGHHHHAGAWSLRFYCSRLAWPSGVGTITGIHKKKTFWLSKAKIEMTAAVLCGPPPTVRLITRSCTKLLPQIE